MSIPRNPLNPKPINKLPKGNPIIPSHIPEPLKSTEPKIAKEVTTPYGKIVKAPKAPGRIKSLSNENFKVTAPKTKAPTIQRVFKQQKGK